MGNGATLAGDGYIYRPVSVASGGTLSPDGTAVGTLTVGYAGGTGVSLSSGATLRIDINYSSYDKLIVNGTVSLGNSTLFLDTSQSSFSLLIIQNNSTSGPGAFGNVIGPSVTISYTGGDGNDVVVTRSPLQAARMGNRADATALLNEADLAMIVNEAILRWQLNGVDEAAIARLRDIQFVVADLSGTDLGLYGGNTILLDRDAAGWGWFVDSTPEQDEEFGIEVDALQQAIDPRAVDQIDLLSVVTHELGHVLGFDDLETLNDVMGETLSAGMRRV